ncbi:MAG: hypothetical protein AAF938_27675 [Myxococcota bacterium]
MATALRRFSELLQAMQTAAREAAEAEATPCAAAHASLEAASRVALSADLPRRPTPPRLAPRARFIELCETLPEPLQRCGRFDYRRDNGEQCKGLFDGATPEVRRKLEEMMQLTREG